MCSTLVYRQELAANKPMSKEEMVDGQVEIMCELFMGCLRFYY